MEIKRTVPEIAGFIPGFLSLPATSSPCIPVEPSDSIYVSRLSFLEDAVLLLKAHQSSR
ncbi:MAG: hypothetical protein ACFB4I_13375 [Cyanophyceae cyanobacterium]